MVDIAPLNYERWAVVVSPLEMPGAPNVKPASAARYAEQLAQVNAAPSRLGSRAEERLVKQNFQPMRIRRKTLERDPEHPLNGPHPTDLNWFFQLPSEVRDSMQNRLDLNPRTVTGLYEQPEKIRGTTVSVSG